jgi:hypothetical protein
MPIEFPSICSLFHNIRAASRKISRHTLQSRSSLQFCLPRKPWRHLPVPERHKYIKVVFDKPDCHIDLLDAISSHVAVVGCREILPISDNRDTDRPELCSNRAYKLLASTDDAFSLTNWVFGESGGIKLPSRRRGMSVIPLSKSFSKNQILASHISCRE